VSPPIVLTRALTTRQALTCEGADTLRCRCRCGGTYHGVKRSAMGEYFEQLPENDPHHTPERSRQMPLPKPVGV